jgi:hypothetical protein
LELHSRQEEPDIADAVLTVIQANMPEEECVSKVSREDLWQHPVLGRLVNSISISRWSGLDRPYVTAPRAAFLPPFSHEFLQSAFAGKNRKVGEYRKRCEQVWLVAAHNLPELATHFSPHGCTLSDAYELAFDRTFVFNVIRKETTEIKAQQNGGAYFPEAADDLWENAQR